MKTSDSRTKLLTERPIPLMISLCVPAVIGMLVVGLYSFMDGVFGRTNGRYSRCRRGICFLPVHFD